jgi:hypothetical protein
MEQLIIEDDYQKWFSKISDNYDENLLMSYNWKDLFKRMEHILKSPMSNFQIRVDVFAFLNRIIDMDFLKKDTEIKTYFNNLIGILVHYTTEANVSKILITL